MHRLKRRWRSLALATAGVAAAALVAAAAGPASVRSSHAVACKPYGTVTYGIAGGGIPALDPNTIASAAQSPLQYLVYPGLTRLTPTGNIAPDIATKWKSSPNLKVWWFWIRHNVKYSDGRPLTSADVVQNILRVLNPATASQARGNIKDFRSVDAIGKYEIRIKLGSPSAIVPYQLFLTKMSDLTHPDQLNTVGNGTGPYKVANFVPNQTLTLVPNPYYAGPKPACFKTIEFLREPDATSMVTDYASGKLDVIWQIPIPDVSKVKAYKGGRIVTPATVSGVHTWEVDTTSPPFDNPLAREALSYAIDRNTMVKVALGGEANASLGNDVINAANPAYDKKLKPYTFNLQKAKQLFQQAGVAPGTTFTFWTISNASRPEWVTMGEILQQDLQKIGYNVDIVQNDISTWLDKFYPAPKKYPGVIVANYLSLQPNPILGLSFLTSGKCECDWNNKVYDGLLLKAFGSAQPAARQKVLDQMQEMSSQQAPVLVIAHQTNILAASNKIAGIWEDPRGDTHLEDAHFIGH